MEKLLEQMKDRGILTMSNGLEVSYYRSTINGKISISSDGMYMNLYDLYYMNLLDGAKVEEEKRI